MTKPKPKPLPSVTQAVKLKCKDLYFRYMSLSNIAAATGVKYEVIKQWVYGNPDAEAIEQTWFNERVSTSEDEFLEIRARNRYQTQLAAAEAIDDTVNSMKLLRERKNKKGQPVPLSPYELQALTNNILNIQKINHVNEVSAPKRDELPANIPQLTSSSSEIIDMEAVAFAMSKDKGILKLISREGLNGAESGSQGVQRAKKQQSGTGPSEANDNRGAVSEADSGERVSEKRIEVVETGSATSRRVQENIEHDSTGKHREPEVDSGSESKTTGLTPSRGHNIKPSDSGGSTDERESDFSGESDLRFTDPFEDEYS